MNPVEWLLYAAACELTTSKVEQRRLDEHAFCACWWVIGAGHRRAGAFTRQGNFEIAMKIVKSF